MKNIDKLKRQLASLEFELRYESDRQEMDNIANQRDAVARRIASMDCDGDIDGKPSRGVICDKCGEVIGNDPAERCKNHG